MPIYAHSYIRDVPTQSCLRAAETPKGVGAVAHLRSPSSPNTTTLDPMHLVTAHVRPSPDPQLHPHTQCMHTQKNMHIRKDMLFAAKTR